MQFKDISATQQFTLTQGGRYLVTLHATTWSTGTVTLQKLSADGSHYISVPAPQQYLATAADPTTVFAADGSLIFDLPAGAYQLFVGGSGLAALYAEVAFINHG